MLTPTAFTQLSTTVSKEDFNLLSIITNSAKGSASLLPIDTEPRTVTSKLGNSSRAIFEAEYIDAPASLTIKTSIGFLK